MMIYHGTGVSRGVAAGPLYCYEPFVPAPPCAGHGGSAGEQRALYEAAKRTARKELGGVCARLEADKLRAQLEDKEREIAKLKTDLELRSLKEKLD